VLYRVGGRLPLHSTALGLVLFAFAPAEVHEELRARSGTDDAGPPRNMAYVTSGATPSVQVPGQEVG
jgi:DNA-binding IclR family transcriptional regulator